MGFVKNRFLGGAEERASRYQMDAGRRAQELISNSTRGAEDQLRDGFANTQSTLEEFLQQAIGTQEGGLQEIIAALTSGTNQAMGTLQAGEDRGIAALKEALSGAEGDYSPYIQAGNQALDLQSALSGALGPEAQQAALDEYMASPGQQFLRDQGEMAITRNASATGDLGGGALLADLQEYGTGLAAQDFQNQFDRLGELSGRGQQASSMLANARLNTGTKISDFIGRSQGGIAGLQASLGRQIADATGSTSGNITNLLTNHGNTLGGLQSQLGTNLAQLLLGEGTNLANLEQGIGAAQAQGALGSVNALRRALGATAGFVANQSGSSETNLNGEASGGEASAGTNGGGEGGGENAGGIMAFFANLFSDRRLKTNIVKIGEYGALNVYSWNWKDGGSSSGFIADEVAKICPNAVTRHFNGYDVVDYGLARKAAFTHKNKAA